MPSWLNLLPLEWVATFALVLARISGLMISAPVLNMAEAPIRVRAMLALALALLLTPALLGSSSAIVETPADLLIAIAMELGLGFTLGFGAQITLIGLQLAGSVISQASGMSLGDVVNPTLDTEVPVFSQLLYYVALAVMLALGGHRIIIDALLDTFTVLPPGRAAWGESLLETVIQVAGMSFHLAIRASAPVLVALLLTTIVLGLISRTLPQLNVLSLGFGLNAWITLAVLALGMAAICGAFEQQLEAAIEAISHALIVEGA